MKCLRCDPIGSIEVKIVIGDEREAIAGLLVVLIDLRGNNVCAADKSLQKLLDEKFKRYIGGIELVDGVARVIENKKPHTLRQIAFVVDDTKHCLTNLIRRGLLKAHQCKSTIVTIPMARVGADFSQANQESLQEIARQVTTAIHQFFAQFPETLVREIRLLPNGNERLAQCLLDSFAQQKHPALLS